MRGSSRGWGKWRVDGVRCVVVNFRTIGLYDK